MVKIVGAEKSVELRMSKSRARKLVDIAKQTFPGCNILDTINGQFVAHVGFRVMPKHFDDESFLYVVPVSNSISVYNRRLLNDAVKLARAYETIGEEDFCGGRVEFTVIEEYSK